jgi:hypothetical protein
VHSNHAFDYSDGYAEAWYLPDAQNIPAGFATEGTFYDYFRDKSPLGGQWGPGNAVFEYPNDQQATTMWYYDHTLTPSAGRGRGPAVPGYAVVGRVDALRRLRRERCTGRRR